MSVSYNKSSSSNSSWVKYLPAGLCISSGCVAIRAIKDECRSDSFVKTAKNCVKEYTVSNKTDIAEFTKFINLNKLAEKIAGVNNKIAFPILFGTGVLANAMLIGVFANCFKDKN